MSKKELTFSDNIKYLYNQINDKTAYILLVCKECGGKPSTKARYWFSRFYSVPEEHQERCINLAQKTIANQPNK